MKCDGSYAMCTVLLSVILVGLSAGQVATGTPPLGTFAGGPDIVNVGNLNVHLDIPIIRKAGRGTNFNYDLTYDSSVWKKVTVSGMPTWQPTSTTTVPGWQGLNPAGQTYITYQLITTTGPCGPMGQNTETQWSYSNFYYHDQFGVAHGLNVSGAYIQTNGTTACPPPGPQPTTVPWTGTASDGSGYTAYISPNGAGGTASGYLTDTKGQSIAVSVSVSPPTTGSTSTTDRNGNQITSVNGTYTDTLNTTALRVISVGGNTDLSYTAPSGSAATYVASYVTYMVHTNFGCSGVAEYPATNTSLVDKVTLPDGTYYQFNYETTPGDTHTPHYVDGRVSSIILPTGGTISYTYTNGNLTAPTASNGVVCADGSTAGLSRVVTPGGTSPAGTWNYARTQVSGAHWQTTVTDPTTAQNQTVTDFWEDSASYNLYPTQALAYQGSSSGGTVLATTITCYNNTNPTPSSCPTTTVSAPINNETIFSYLPNSSGLQTKTFISYYQGIASFPTEVDSYSYGTGSVGALVRKVVTAYGTYGYGAILPTSTVVEDGSSKVVASTTFKYDENSVTTTGATQHVSVGAGRGNLTTIATQVNSTQTLYRNFDYYDTGMVQDAYDYSLSSTTHGPKNSYAYDNTGTPPQACDYAFPTTVTLPNGLSRSMTWNCTGGVQTSATDENGKAASIAYNDASFWRPTSASDPLTYVTSISYSGATVATSSLPFNGTSSVAELRAQVDGLSRSILSQQRQSPGSTNYDTFETDYDAAGNVAKVTLPFSATAGGTSSAAPGTTSSYDGLGRPLTVSYSGSGSITYNYSQNDVLQTVGPAPTGETTKSKQSEYDSLGRLTSVCELTNVTGSGSCGQNSAQIGFWTKYTYDLIGDLTGVTQNAQAASSSQQARAYTFDMIGRLLTETNPETQSTTYAYDALSSDPACGTVSYPGNLVKRVDANGNVTCYTYDSLQRLLTTTYPSGPNSANTPTKKYAYGAASTTTINGVTLSNTADRMVEAYTCFGTCASKTTDLLFNYSPRGEVADVYESTPNSGTGYYHASSQYWANGALNTLSLLNASGTALIPVITYGADGEGRASAITAASGTNPVYSTSYNTASQVTNVNYMASGSDNDVFTFDMNTLRLTDYQFNVGSPSKQDWGHLNWNQNGTLGSLAIVDPFNANNSQTCNYSHDHLGRLASENPATPNIACGTKWSQTITLDAFGNISKAATVGTNFQATYVPSSGQPTNRIVQVGSSNPGYDNNGNLTNDTLHQYTWDAEGEMLTIDNGISTGVCLTYDALGRMVEQGRGATCATHTQIAYSPGGSKLALLSGQTLQKAFVPLTGGATAVYNASGLQYFRHTDWLGSSRLATTPGRTMYYDTAYAPYGEDYVGATGAGGAKDLSFTGQNEDTTSWMYDFMFRQYNQTQGRWMSPDPAGLSMVDLSNPQSWNKYGYVLNSPLGIVDPLGFGCRQSVGTVTVPNGGDGGAETFYILFETCDDSGGPQGLGGGGGGAGNKGKLGCAGQALLNNGVSILLDAAGIIPGVGNLVSGDVAVAKSISSTYTAGTALVSTGHALMNGDFRGAAASGTSFALAVGNGLLGGSKAIPVLGNFVSFGALGYDAYKAYQQYHQCKAGG